MSRKKPATQKSVPVGISLEPAVTVAARKLAAREGFTSLSAFVRYQLTQAINAAENAGQREIKKAKGKLRRR